MNSFLITKKDKKSYEEKLSSSPESTKRNKKYAVKLFERFIQEKYKKSLIIVIEEINKIRKEEPGEYFEFSNRILCLKEISDYVYFMIDFSFNNSLDDVCLRHTIDFPTI